MAVSDMKSKFTPGKWMVLLLSTLLFLSTGIGSGTTPAQANSISNLTEVAQEAFSDLTTCLTSGQEKTIDVFYLIDDSDSLLYTDPGVVREQILADSVVQLASFAEQGITVNVSSALFSTSATPVFDWRQIGNQSDATEAASALSSAVRASAVQTGSVKWTNWEAGLSYAAGQLERNNPEGSNCQALIWFTDGGIRLGQDKTLSLPSLANLCHSDISATNLQRSPDSRLGLMAELRRQNVGIFALFYANEQGMRESWSQRGSSPAEVEEQLNDFRYFSSFLTPLVEGSGTVFQDYAPPGFPPGAYLECANLGADGKALAGEANGAFLDAQDPITLAFQFLKLQAQLGGGNTKEIGDGGRFEIRPGTEAFRVLTTSDSWTLTDPEGKLRASPQSPAPAVVVSERTGVTTITLPVQVETDLGVWEFKPDEEVTVSSLFVYAGLTLALDRDRETPIVLGRDNSLGGVVVRQPQFADIPVDLSVYDASALSLEIIENGAFQAVEGVSVEGPEPTSGSFRIDGFSPDRAAGDEIEVQLTLALGGDFQPIKSRFSLQVVSSRAFPLLENTVIVLSPLDGPEGVAQGVLRVTPPADVASGEFCIARTAKRVSDPQSRAIQPVERLEDWAWSFEAGGKIVDVGSTACFEVPQSDQPFLINVSAVNPIQADSTIESVHGVTSGEVSRPAAFGEDIVFSFDSSTQQSQSVFWIVFLALLALGILVPLALLYILNRASTRFVWPSGMVRAEFPVEASLGFTAQFIDTRTGQPLTVGPQDFVFVTDRANPRGVDDEPHGFPVAQVPLFPLSAPWMEWIASMGSRVVSIYDGAQKSPGRFHNGKVAEISPVMADNWALILPENELSASGMDSKVRGVLVVYASMGDLAHYQARIAKIQTTPGIVERIQAVKDSLAQEAPAGSGGVVLETAVIGQTIGQPTISADSPSNPNLPKPPTL
jgi:hypothetical protein